MLRADAERARSTRRGGARTSPWRSPISKPTPSPRRWSRAAWSATSGARPAALRLFAPVPELRRRLGGRPGAAPGARRVRLRPPGISGPDRGHL